MLAGRRFVKMHGAGNDFIIVQPQFFDLSNKRTSINTFSEQDKQLIVPQVISLCRSKFSVGADGVLVVSEVEGRYKMSVFNSNGQMGANCGNGLRCVALYLLKTKSLGNNFVINTDSGDKLVEISHNEKGYQVRINLGVPVINPIKIDLTHHIKAQKYLGQAEIYSCNIGNNHYVAFLGLQEYEKIGEDNAYAAIASEIVGNQLINLNFCHIQSRRDLRIVTCEFGAGVTLACGTGSTASAFVGFNAGKLDKQVNVHTRGGLLVIDAEKKQQDYEVYMKGPAEWVFSGELQQ